MSVRFGVIALVGVALSAVGIAAPAAATQGSVPVEVADYATAPDGLIRGLDDFFGPGADGTGIDFDESTEIGAVARVFSFTPDWLAGDGGDTAVSLANEWTVPIVVGGDPVGVAVIWINPGTVKPQLADFVPDAGFATVLAGIPAEAYVVQDEPRAAWFAFEPPTLTALVSGSSGVNGEVSLDSYQDTVTRPAPVPPAEEPALGSVLSVVTIIVVVLVVALALLVPPALRRRRAEAAEAEADDTEEPEPEPVPKPKPKAKPRPKKIDPDEA